MRTTLQVQEARVGSQFFRPDDLLAKPEAWWRQNVGLVQFTATAVKGDPIPLAATRRMLLPNPKTGAEAVQISIRRTSQGAIHFQIKDKPVAPNLLARALLRPIESVEQDSLFFLEQRMLVLRALRNDRAAPELEQPPRLPKLRAPASDHMELLANLPDEAIGVIVGPPGTGKTQAISDLALQLQKEGKSCLLLSWTKIAVEEALERVVARGGRARRLGRAEADIPTAAWDDEVDWVKIAAGEEGLPMFGDRATEPGIIGATFLQAFVRFNAEYTFEADRFDVVLVDESSQAPFEAVLFAMWAGKRVILLGDPIQLPPVYKAEDRLDARSRKETPDCLSGILHERSDLHVLLDTQYRSMPGIMDWSNRSFYGGRLRNGRPEDGKSLSFRRKTLPRVLLVSVPGEPENNRNNAHTVAKAKSYLASAARQLPALGLPSRGLYITPYREQADRATDALRSVALDLTIGTVDASQGKQAPIVVFDLCSAKETRFWNTPTMARRFNVALTRATHHLIILVPEGLLASARIAWLRSLLTAYPTE